MYDTIVCLKAIYEKKKNQICTSLFVLMAKNTLLPYYANGLTCENQQMLALILGYVLQTKKQDSRDYAETSIETGHNTHTQQFIFSPKIAMRPQNFPLVINFIFSCSCPIFYGLKWYFTMVIFFLKPVGLSSTFFFPYWPRKSSFLFPKSKSNVDFSTMYYLLSGMTGMTMSGNSGI